MCGGDRLIPDSYSKSFGNAESGSVPRVTFTLANFTKRSITILGSKSSCTCVLTLNLPMEIAPSQKLPLNIEVLTRRKTGSVSESIRLYTDIPEECDLTLTLSGRVTAPFDRGNTAPA